VLSKFQHIENIPDDIEGYGMTVGRARRLAENLEANKEQAFLYRQLATLRLDVPIKENLDDLEWRGARNEFKTFCQGLGADSLIDQIPRWRSES
jgi:5'-3' exonuclease